MKKYRIYLSKSPEVAYLLSKAHRVGEDGVTSVRNGPASSNNI